MRIEVFSDVVCPWCYIGKRRLERALSDFSLTHPDSEVEVVWRSYQLDPGAPITPVETVAESLGRKYGGGPAAGQRMIDQVEAVAAEEGLVYRLGRAQRVGTRDAHRLLHAAAEDSPALQGALKERLLAAYFLEARNVADHEELLALATEAGLDETVARRVLAGEEHADAVVEDIDRALSYGVRGVPFTVVDGRYGVSGAQPVEVFADALERAWADAHPALVMAGPDAEGGDDASGAVCGPDGCTT